MLLRQCGRQGVYSDSTVAKRERRPDAADDREHPLTWAGSSNLRTEMEQVSGARPVGRGGA